MAARPAEAEGPDDPPWNATPRAARSPCAPRLEVGSARTSSSSLGGGGSLGDWWLEEEAPRAQPRGALRAQVIALDSLDTPEHPEDAAQDPTRAPAPSPGRRRPTRGCPSASPCSARHSWRSWATSPGRRRPPRGLSRHSVVPRCFAAGPAPAWRQALWAPWVSQ
ncbi:unnamed protein product [Prorocentrum cordatum]|uniref:Uncharacterized protein n=1 Tax=Prorocentrum cordatum TaxID=2364126 RepID=A0ABN9XLT1_9DINO|nr:unnamed protein product [Polarella glacialis]